MSAIAPPTPDEVAALLRTVEFTIDRTETSFVTCMDRRYVGPTTKRDLDRMDEAKRQVRAMLDRLPPEPPMTPEREASVGQFLGAVLDKRFGEGSQEAVAEALDGLMAACERWAVKWFDDSPRGATWGVASIDEVLCYTTPSEQGWADAQRISLAVSCDCYPDPRDHEHECLIRQTDQDNSRNGDPS